MLFNSYIFVLIFLPVVLIGYFSLNHHGKGAYAKTFLIFASLLFYGYYDWSYLFIIASSVIVNYSLSQWMLGERRHFWRRFAFAAGLVFNLGSLFYFKYIDFCIGNLNLLFQSDLNISTTRFR